MARSCSPSPKRSHALPKQVVPRAAPSLTRVGADDRAVGRVRWCPRVHRLAHNVRIRRFQLSRRLTPQSVYPGRPLICCRTRACGQRHRCRDGAMGHERPHLHRPSTNHCWTRRLGCFSLARLLARRQSPLARCSAQSHPASSSPDDISRGLTPGSVSVNSTNLPRRPSRRGGPETPLVRQSHSSMRLGRQWVLESMGTNRAGPDRRRLQVRIGVLKPLPSGRT